MIGSELDGYRLVEELGAGGMGTVYLAERDGEKVAVKVIHPHLLATSGFFKRFLREAELGRKVAHPNVVRTLDVDATLVGDKQVNYMVMEYVEGKSLRDLLIRLRTIPETLLREIALQTAAGLAAIHGHDIVHRDLKPENILITDDNEVRIMDLGVAKLQEASIAITKEGQFAGSVLYAAPEQFRSEDVGPASDQYSLGVMLYELATGENPFRRDDAAQVIQAHLVHDPARVDERNSEVSSFLAEVTATLLAKKPGERFASAGQLHDVLAEGESSAWWKEHAPKIAKREAHLPRIRVHRETELHGRADDLEALQDAWKEACEGHGNSVLIEGEPGIGKTRLVDAFVRGVEDAHVLYGSYPPSGGLGGLSDAIVGKFGAAGLEDAVRPYLPDTPTLVPAFAALIKHEAPPTGAETMHGDALHAVCVQLMRSLAAERPTVWIVDDLQFADKESRDLVLSLARAADGHRVLLLFTTRPGLPEEELAHFSRLENLKRIGLGRLSPREILDLLADAFKSESLAEKLGGKIALKSDGVPFFVFEMIRGLKEGQFLQQTADGSYVQTEMITDIEVPSAVKDLIDGRMKGLSEGQRAILDVGAVQGMTFDPGLVAAVLEEKKIRVLRDIAEIERRFGLVRGEDTHIRFDQNQIQEVLYSSLIPDLRREYHSLLAEAYEGDDPYFLALHHLKGSRPKRGLEHVGAALDKLLSGYRNDAAFELMDLALKHVEGRERLELLLRKAKRLDEVGNYKALVRVAEEAHGLAGPEDALRVRALGALAAACMRVGRLAEASEPLRDRLALARKLGDRKEEAAAERTLGRLAIEMGHSDDALGHTERALAMSVELADREGEASAQSTRGIALTRLGRHKEAIASHQSSLVIARELRDRNREGGTHVNLGINHLQLGEVAEAEEHFERGREILREVGNRSWEANAIANLGSVQANRGHLAKALPLERRFLELKIETGDRPWEAGANGRLAGLLLALGRLDEAQQFADRFVHLGRDLGGTWMAQSLRMQAACAMVRGNAEEAARLYRQAAMGERADEEARTLAHLGLARLCPADAKGLLEGCAASDPGFKVLAAALLGDKEAARAAFEEHGAAAGVEVCMEAHFRIGDVEKAHELLMHLVEHAPEDCRESMIENVPLHKEIVEAYERAR